MLHTIVCTVDLGVLDRQTASCGALTSCTGDAGLSDGWSDSFVGLACRFGFAEGVTSGGEDGNDTLQLPSRPPVVNREADADGKPAVVEGGQLQLQLLEPDKSEQQPLGLDSNFQEYIK
jgi:hypothetical protein